MWKQCPRCLEPKNLEDFAKKAKSKDGRQSWCKKCLKEIMGARYKANPEKHLLQNTALRNSRIEILNEVKHRTKCLICKEIDPCCLDFHHVNPTNKTESVAKLIAFKVKLETILAETEKCIVLCASCHRKVHAGSITVVLT